MSWTASVVTSATTDTEPSIILSFNSAKYIFNVAENSNRAFTQKKAHRKSTRAFFLTQVGAQRSGGLAGMLMSSADQMLNTLDVVGPPGVTHSIASMRSYIYRNSMSVNVNEVSLSPDLTSSAPPCTYQDKNITVYSFPVSDSSSTPISVDPSAQSTDITIEVGSTKRKRESSEALKELMDSDDFSPEKLEGELAQEWRKLMIKTMFPAPHKAQPPSPTRRCGPPNKRQKTNSAEKPRSPERSKNFDMYNRPKIPTGYHQQLPKLTRPWSAAPPTLAYVIVGPSVRGKFDVEKSIAIGVPKNMRSKLTGGQSITVEVKDGDNIVEKVINPLDCIGPSEIPAVAIVLDIPSPTYIPSVVSSFEQSPLYAKLRSTRPEDLAEFTVRIVFHLCGDGVLEDPRYVEFMNGFPPSAHHIISSPEYGRDPVTFTTAAFNQLRLHQLDAEMFPLPYHSLESEKELSIIPNLPDNCLVMEPSIHMSVRPPGRPETGRLPAERKDLFHPATTSDDPELLFLYPSVLEKFAEAKTKVEQEALTRKISPGADVGVIPLGTASAVPTSSRNVSSTLIRIPSRGSILLDAGEGTYGQLARHFGPDVGDVLRDLRCVFVSHIHGDHHTGVAKILAKRRQLNPPPTNPLYLVSIHKLHLYLRELSEIEDLGLDDPAGNGVVTIMSDALHFKRSGEYVYQGMWRIEGAEPWTDYERSTAAGMRLCVALGLQSFNTIDVFHQVKCYGVSFRSQDGWSITFSADTLPTQSLVRGGQDATLLIHEATMGDGEEAMARAKAHSTVGQAIEIARKMNAENVLLTHFSARYPRLPPPVAAVGPTPVEAAGATPPIVALAFDHANLTIGSIWKLNMYLPAIQQVFADTSDEADEEEVKAALEAAP
ncbi:hypothetical protein C8F04DRAFT_1037200 [Mycena alexandri]|uniref:ribonuclease Z n=1 Tax=Mycena alexandri TaxID=1745969 RepID=A0AAD6X820_9AGAR|nr:hypothetical protein C8F04DRAFT_1037200 [Mycena alexandri]